MSVTPSCLLLSFSIRSLLHSGDNGDITLGALFVAAQFASALLLTKQYPPVTSPGPQLCLRFSM